MQHVDPEIVLRMNVSAHVYQKLTSVRIALERCEMQGCEPVAIVFCVDPFSHLLFGCELGIRKLYQCLKTCEAVSKGALVK